MSELTAVIKEVEKLKTVEEAGKKTLGERVCWELSVYIPVIKGCTKNSSQSDDFDSHQLFFLRHFQIFLLG